jgi:hypothetical protein
MAYRFRPQQNLINRQNNHLIYNPIPWHQAAYDIGLDANFGHLINATGSYHALDNLKEDIYRSSIEDALIPQEIREEIDKMLIRELNNALNQHTAYTLDLDNDEFEDIIESNNSLDKIKQYISQKERIPVHQLAFTLAQERVLNHYIDIWKNRRRDEQNLAMAGVIDRPRYNILMFPIGRVNTRVFWHMLTVIPVFKGRHLTQLFPKTSALIRKVTRIGEAFNQSFLIESVKFFLYQRPYSPSQVFMRNNSLLTLSASLVSPTFNGQNTWQPWVANLTRWFDSVERRREVLTDDEIMQQFQIEINVDQTSYLRANDIFKMIESIYRNKGDVLKSYIFVVDIGMSSDLIRVNPAPNLDQFRV